VTGITQTTALWYASRATGVVALVLLTAVLVLGMLVNRQGRLPELVALDEWGYPIVPDRPVPRALDRTARRAVADCPALALALIRVP
jgi:hypothetical protein